ncbi:TIGR02281 family clan AA aspartic protease [Paraglaciecola aquimarina]|uniref:TIGR02281 family clan AA aspartic protease n=1 Tax=Paraglaciecola algarum TaxID=3050085 RepID=A0ABS9D9L3_9ALTE|nr:TIGR02281 family clan AA aspartic protease [Paraglaciecola sp. G1-23]MCF2948682.1 TIGR02281 family clan AA aspartic protease [Paraglaciecola sp. G1-23]
MKQAKLGKGMIIIAWVIGLGLLTLLFDEQLAKQLNPNAEPISSSQFGVAEVKLKQNRAGHYVSGGAINDQPVVFMLDTGATQVSIPMHLAEQLSLQKGNSSWVQTANGRVQVFQTRIQRLTIGEIQLTDIAAHLNPAMHDGQILLGMSALKQLEFTQRGEWLTLRNL